MPMFDFYCSSCQHEFEDLVFDNGCPACPRCGKQTERRVSAPSPLKTGAFPFKPGPVHGAAAAGSGLNVGCSGSGGFK